MYNTKKKTVQKCFSKWSEIGSSEDKIRSKMYFVPFINLYKLLLGQKPILRTNGIFKILL